MRHITIAVAFVLLIMTVNIGLGAQGPLKVIPVNNSNSSSASSGALISLSDAAARSQNNSSSNGPEMKNETVENEDFIRNEVSAGNTLFVRSLFDGVYDDTHNSSQNGVFTVLTHVPDPYENNGITKLYGGYLNLSLYMIVLFIFGALTSRSLARTKLVRKANLSQAAFVGGIATCCFALVANILYSSALDLIQALNTFIALPAMPDIIPDPDNLVLFVIQEVCNLILLGFFVARYYIIYIVAVVCSIIAVLLVPEFTRDFATNCIEKIVRILFLQPAALFVYVVCLISTDDLPSGLKALSYIGMNLIVLLTCWYFLFGNFTLLKRGISFAIKKGVTKV